MTPSAVSLSHLSEKEAQYVSVCSCWRKIIDTFCVQVLTCTSESQALSLMHAAGVSGGLFANSTDHTVSFPTSALSSPGSPLSTPSITGSGEATDPGVSVVTVTVTMPLTLPIETRTLSPQDALSIIASLSSEGFTASTLAIPTLATSSDLHAFTQSSDPDCPGEATASTIDKGAIATVLPESPYQRRSTRARRRTRL